MSDAMSEPADALDRPERRPNAIRRLYDWCLSWAETPYGTPALFVMSFAEASFFPIPPDVLQIALSVSKPRRSLYYAGVSAVASVLGAIVGWLIGYAAWGATQSFFFEYVPGFTPELFERVRGWYDQNAFLYISIAAFTPIPFKIFTIASGVANVSLLTLVVASALSRSARFFLVGSLFFAFGAKIKPWIDKYLESLAILLGVLGVGGFLVLKYLHH